MWFCIVTIHQIEQMVWGYTRHGKEKSQKCNQCDFACHNQGNLKVHFRIHNGEKPYHCNQCDFACSEASNLNVHVKTHSGEKSNATSVTIHLPLLVIWKVIWKHTLAKSAINANCATLQPLKLVIWIDTCWRTVVLILGFWRTRIGRCQCNAMQWMVHGNFHDLATR